MGLDITISTKKHTLDFRKRNWLMGWVKKTLDIPEIENCETYLLSRDRIDDLMDDISKVLEDHSKAEEILPCCEGFFFGSTKYDDYYFADLKDAKERLRGMFIDMSDGETAEFWSWW